MHGARKRMIFKKYYNKTPHCLKRFGQWGVLSCTKPEMPAWCGGNADKSVVDTGNLELYT